MVSEWGCGDSERIESIAVAGGVVVRQRLLGSLSLSPQSRSSSRPARYSKWMPIFLFLFFFVAF